MIIIIIINLENHSVALAVSQWLLFKVSLSNNTMSAQLLSAVIRLSDSTWTKGLHTHTTVFSAGCSQEKKHFCFPSVELFEKKQADRFARPFQPCPDMRVSVFPLRSHHYSPGAPKPMDVIRCPLTSMCSNSGDLTTHAPSHTLTWWKRHSELTAADVQQQNISRFTCFPLSNLLSAMCL